MLSAKVVTRRFKSSSSSSSLSSPSSLLYSEEFWQSPNVIDVTPLAESLRNQVRQYTSSNPLRLVGILADFGTFRQDAELYSERIQESCQADGIHYDIWRCPSLKDVQSSIEEANHNNNVDGILVFYPIFPSGTIQQENDQGGVPEKQRLPGVYYKTTDDYYRNLVLPTKDVEGLCGTRWFHHSPLTNTTGKEFRNQTTKATSFNHHHPHSPRQIVYPCTAISVQQILDHYHAHGDWENQVVSIVNRSEIVGRPLAAMLAGLGATVYSIDVNSILRFQPHRRLHRYYLKSLEDCLEESTIVVTGVPQETFQIPTERLQEGTTLVNVSEFTNVCEAQIMARPDICYIPLVGKVTVAMLQQNLMKLHQQQKESHSLYSS